MMAQVYTWPADTSVSAEVVIEAAVTEMTCGRELLGETVEARGGAVQVTDLTLAMPDYTSTADSTRGEITRLARHLVQILTARGETVACAESLTGGWLTAALVDIPGASVVVRGGMVSYATDLKASWLGVDPELLAARGAVDPTVAAEMAQGVCRAAGSHWGLATTGWPDRGRVTGRLRARHTLQSPSAPASLRCGSYIARGIDRRCVPRPSWPLSRSWPSRWITSEPPSVRWRHERESAGRRAVIRTGRLSLAESTRRSMVRRWVSWC